MWADRDTCPLVRPHRLNPFLVEVEMRWTKPEFEVVEVTMEVTAYVARR